MQPWILVILVCLLCAKQFVSMRHYVRFDVDQLNGNDFNKCLTSQQPCKSLLYVYQHIIVSSYYQADVFITRDYYLNQSLHLTNVSATAKLSKLRFIGTNNTKVIANNSKSTIQVGEKENEKKLGYLIIFEKLSFYFFGEFVAAAVVIWLNPVHINYCHFDSNNCAGINAFDSELQIQNCIFKNNTGSGVKRRYSILLNETLSFPYGQQSAGGALAIIFSEMSFKNLTIINNVFKSNRAVANTGKYIKQYEDGKLTFSHTGGGLLLAFINNASSVNLTLFNNSFDANRASLGGGLMIGLYHNAGFNGITLLNVNMTRNQGSVTGGGFVFGCWNYATSNSFVIINSTISYNGARIGGGGNIIFESRDLNSPESPSYQRVSFKNVHFIANNAACVSGLHMIYNLPVQWKSIYPVIFQNVVFSNHSTYNIEQDQDGSSSFSGVLLSNRVDILFGDCNEFIDNTSETPLYVSNSVLTLMGNLSFISNQVSTSGGGITLTDVSHICLHPGSHLLFKNNSAQVQGGAMFVRTVGFPDMVYKYNPSCFFQYKMPNLHPSLWNVSVEFVGNSAGLKGAAVFANTITPCIWDDKPPFYNFKKALRWDGFNYSGNYIRGDETYSASTSNRDDISTDTISFGVKTNNEKGVEASPGQDIPFYIYAYDELQNLVYSVPLASITFDKDVQSDSKGIGLERSYFIVEPNDNTSQVLQYTVPNTTYQSIMHNGEVLKGTIHFVDSYSSFRSNATIKLNFTTCRPGFKYQDGICMCNLKDDNIVRCDNELVYIKEGYWATYQDKDLIVKNCPRKFCFCKSNNTLAGCAFNFKYPDLQCADYRHGTLCGKCQDGYGLNLMTFKCVKCTDSIWSTLFLLLIVSLIVIIAVLVLVLNPHFSTHFRGILFFLQMLPYVCDHSGVVESVVISISSSIDLGGVNSIPITSCFKSNFNSLDAILLGYLYPTLIFTVLLVLFLLHKFRMVNFRRNSPFQSSWILLVAMYKFLVETSLLLLFCVPLKGDFVFFYDGMIKCYKNYHLILTFVASIVLVAAVIPPPILVLLIIYGHIRVGPIITDALTQGLRKHVRWWWSVDFVRRIVFISVYVFITDWKLKQTILSVVSILTLFFHMQMQPYRNKHANFGESMLLLCLTLLATITETKSTSDIQNVILYCVLALSMIYCVFIIFYLITTFIIKLCRSRGYFQLEDDDEDTDDEDVYNESFQRRIAVPSFCNVETSSCSTATSIAKKKKKTKNENTNKRDVIVQSPSYLRSDLEDSIDFNASDT